MELSLELGEPPIVGAGGTAVYWVAGLVGASEVFWRLPWALAIAAGWVVGVVGLVLAYVPLVALALRFRAGVR